jgi:hypothetical protein
MEIDGETEITLGSSHEVDPGVRATYEGILETPSRGVAVLIVPNKKILETKVTTTRTRIRIWANDSWEPDQLRVGLN